MTASIDIYGFAILAAMLWGLSPVIAKKGLERGGTSMLASVVAVAVSFSLLFGFTTIAYGPTKSYLGMSSTAVAIFFFGGVVGSSIGRLMVYAGIDRVGASVNTAVMNTRPVFAAILAVALLGEPLSVSLVVGLLAITGGIAVLSLSRGGDIRGWQSYELAFPIAAAIAYAAGNVVRRYGFTVFDSDPLSALVWNELAALIIIFAYIFARYDGEIFDVPRSVFGFFVLGGLLSGAGLLSLFTALSRGPVVIVDPLSGTTPLFSTLFAYILLQRVERVTHGVIFGAIIVISGVLFVTIP